MIVEWFMSLAASFSAWLVTIFPPWSVPDWFTSADGGFATVVGMANGMNAWVDMALASTLISAIVGVWLVAVVIKLIMKAVGHVPGVGGNG